MKIISWNVNGLRAVHRKNEFMPLVHEALSDDIDAPGMELYDNYDAHRPSPKP